jgi:hypothetical protein
VVGSAIRSVARRARSVRRALCRCRLTNSPRINGRMLCGVLIAHSVTT